MIEVQMAIWYQRNTSQANDSRVESIGKDELVGCGRISIFDMRQWRPLLNTSFTASSKCEYFTENSSFDIPSFMELPRGCDKSSINLREPPFFGREPSGEQCNSGQGGSSNDPAVCFLFNSLQMAVVTASGCSVADFRFFGLEATWRELKPIRKLLVKPSIK